MPLSPAQRVILAAASVAVAAGIAVTARGGDDAPEPARNVVTTVARAPAAPTISGYDLAGDLSQTDPLRTSPSTFAPETLTMVAEQQGVETERAWPLAVPGDDRTAWLFVGDTRLALVMPRTVTGPDGEALPDDVSIFGARIADLTDQPLIATQAGAGQDPRTILLVPAGVEPPRIVARDGTTPIRPMARRGRLYADRIRPGEQLVVGSRRIGPTVTD